MAVSKRKKIFLAVLLVLALAIFLPPNINGARLRRDLATALTSALGRPVRIGSVSYRLLPRPGFDLYDFEVADDPTFDAEPLLRCGKVTADLRLTSLWRGRLEIANLKLQNDAGRVPPSLNLVYLNGHWNLESLLVRAEQIPTAPTSRKRAEQRPRFPYLEADAGRINIKVGPEKKPYALVNTDFALWLAAEDLWHVRLEGHPVRTDMNLSDTGDIKIEGDVKRSPDLRQTPVKLQIFWQSGQLGQLSTLALGHDKGWRGALNMKADLTGSLLGMHVTAEGDLQNFRRYDINRRGMFDISTRCLGEYSEGLLDFNCSLPLETGGLLLKGKFSPFSPSNYDLSLVANRVPLSAVATFARYAKRTLPDDLTATGQFDAAFGFHSHDNLPQEWHGTGMTSPFIVRSSVAVTPVQVSSIHFRIGVEENKNAAPGRKRSRIPKTIPQSEARSFLVDPFSIQLGTDSSLQARGTFHPTDYLLALKGTAPLARVLDLGRIAGFHSRILNSAGSADLDMSVHGTWANFAPTGLGGTAHLENIAASVPGVKERLLLPTADVHFSDSDLVLITVAHVEHSPLELSGSISSAVNCQSDTPCPFQFDLRADSLDTRDVFTLLAADQKGWNLPFISSLVSNQLPDFRARGTLSVANLKIGRLPLEKFIAHIEVGDRVLLINQINARMADGSTQGEWRIDWSVSPPRYIGNGNINGVSAEDVPLSPSASSLLSSWITGKTNLKYAIEFSGRNGADMLAGAQAHAEFAVASGMSHALALQPERPTRFQALQGKCDLNHQVLEFLPSKFKAENRIYEVRGTISLASNQANLMVNNSSTQWQITGTLDNPDVVSQRLTAQNTPAQVQ